MKHICVNPKRCSLSLRGRILRLHSVMFLAGTNLKIFLLKKKGITDEIREKYLKEVLPEMVRKYKDHNRDDFLQEQSYRLIVVLRDKEFKFYEIIK